MKKILALLLCLITLLSLAACGNKPNDQTEPTKETTPMDTYPYPQINTKLTRDALNALPVKSDNMTIQQMRETCVQFMRFSKTALWTPNNNMQFVKNPSNAIDEITKGIVYAGLPYVGSGGCGNVYRMLDNINEETGVMDMKEAIASINETLPPYKHLKHLTFRTQPFIKTSTAKVKRFEEMKNDD